MCACISCKRKGVCALSARIGGMWHTIYTRPSVRLTAISSVMRSARTCVCSMVVVTTIRRVAVVVEVRMDGCHSLLSLLTRLLPPFLSQDTHTLFSLPTEGDDQLSL